MANPVDELQAAEEHLGQKADEESQQQAERLLESLQAPSVFQTVARERRLEMILPEDCEPAVNIRPTPSPASIEEMAVSISQHGVLQTVAVYESADPDAKHPYILLAGRRRLEACMLIERRTDRKVPLPAMVFELRDGETEIPREEIEQLMLLENVGREDLDERVVARAVRRAIEDNPELTAAEIALSLGKSAKWVRFHLRLERGLPDDVLAMLENDDLSFRAADLLRREHEAGTDPQAVREHAEQLASGEKDATGLERELREDPDSPLHRPSEHEDEGDEQDAPSSDGEADQRSREPEVADPGPAADPDSSSGSHIGSNAEGAGRTDGEEGAADLDDWGGESEGKAERPAASRAQAAEASAMAAASETVERNVRADTFLLAWLIEHHASDETLAEIEVDREDAREHAAGLPAQERLDQIRTVALALAEAAELEQIAA